MKDKMAALVVTYNRALLLDECIMAILNQSHSVDAVVVVDNASTDDTDKIMEKYSCDSRIVYIKLDKNIGGAGGFSKGVSEIVNMGFDWIWLMDDDTIPEKECLEKLVCASKIEPKASFFASNVYGMDGQPMNTPSIALNSISENGYGNYFLHLKDRMIEIESATFVSLLIPTWAVKKIGIPCAFFFIWGDDVEFTLRLTRNCGRAYLVGDSCALHKRKGGRDLGIVNETNERRIQFYSYKVRNTLYIDKAYWGTQKFRKDRNHFIRQVVKIAFASKVKKKLKMCAIIKGLSSYYFMENEREEFESRYGAS